MGVKASRKAVSSITAAASKTSRARVSRSSPSRSSQESDFANDAELDQLEEDEDEQEAPAAKRRKTAKSATAGTINAYRGLLAQQAAAPDARPTLAPTRKHALGYHTPLLLNGDFGRENRDVFLKWFDSVSLARAMPWRQPWIDTRKVEDASKLRAMLERRAYQVWISEIMLQQTRVAAVIEYWNKWMAKWPTIQELAAASSDDVLAAWRGLGYYSRATRIHDAAKAVVADKVMDGLLPDNAADLESKVAGVGRYTAGAISCIVFGRPAPMVDGNVLRVLSRQLGIYGNIKTDKAVIDMIWAAADALVRAVAKDVPEGEEYYETSDRPGRWGQGLMELGSTVCTPKPNCAECPITKTCRAYAEGAAYTAKTKPPTLTDIEDMCTVCEPFEEDEVQAPETPLQTTKKQGKQMTLAAFAFTKAAPKPVAAPAAEPKVDVEKRVEYAKKFPVKVAKKAVRVEETLVCAIRRADGQYLIHRRPEKGLLAGLWEFPSSILPTNDLAPAKRKQLAKDHTSSLVGKDVKYVADLGSVPWLFSHIKLTMHVYLFTLDEGGDVDAKDKRWTEDVDSESMGTGMRKCWDLVKDA
ncbi:hypothetical protein VHEMI02508 [[Torrubiella] hemipterigena]|uniref:Adenine DNA glycosylase n=1 Tax=[Torrubiella] hemipterigena TaxID=1531966 RepID=A0A0A1SVY6_9HYPO|nr:hypothetical protein VHEMI02508 [[Torrubiella] hemipterigena]